MAEKFALEQGKPELAKTFTFKLYLEDFSSSSELLEVQAKEIKQLKRSLDASKKKQAKAEKKVVELRYRRQNERFQMQEVLGLCDTKIMMYQQNLTRIIRAKNETIEAFRLFKNQFNDVKIETQIRGSNLRNEAMLDPGSTLIPMVDAYHGYKAKETLTRFKIHKWNVRKEADQVESDEERKILMDQYYELEHRIAQFFQQNKEMIYRSKPTPNEERTSD